MHRRSTRLVALAALVCAGAWYLRGSAEPAPSPVAEAAPIEHHRKPLREAPAKRKTAPSGVGAPAPASVAPEVDHGGPVVVSCPVGRGLEGREHVLTVADPTATNGARLLQGSYDGENLVLEVPREAHGAQIVFPGTTESAVSLAWSGDDDRPRCTVSGALPDPADAPLFGTVRGAANLSEGSVFLEGCAASAEPVGADGSFFAVTSEGACRMRAWRQAGSLRVPGPWVAVDAIAGAEVEVELRVPTFAPAGMGIGFTTPGGGPLTVSAVHDGTPANQAGLGVGDQITAIDGVATDGMDADGFLQHGLGPEGSQVRLEGTTADGEAFEVVITRRALGPI